MFHAPTTESKQQNDSTRSQSMPERTRELSPRVPATMGPVLSSASAPPPANHGMPKALARLHSAYGNQAVLRMVSPQASMIQIKLTVNQPGDQYEQEADRVADQVMHMLAPPSHDLTHVVQQRGQAAAPAVQRQPKPQPESEVVDARDFATHESLRRIRDEIDKICQQPKLSNSKITPQSSLDAQTAQVLDDVMERAALCGSLSQYITTKPQKLSQGHFVVHKHEKINDLYQGSPSNINNIRYLFDQDDYHKKVRQYLKDTDPHFSRKSEDEQRQQILETGGFYDRKNDVTNLPSDGTFGSALHESVHRVSEPAFKGLYGPYLNEGVTQWFTDLILHDEGLPPHSGHTYGPNLADAHLLIDKKAGMELVAELYFKSSDAAHWEILARLGLIKSGTKTGYFGEQEILKAIRSSAPKPPVKVQPKLTDNQPGNSFEQEADLVADQVMRMTDSTGIQRKCSTCEEEDKLQRKCAECEEEEKKTGLHRKQSGAGSQFAPSAVQAVLNSAGRPLDPATRAFMEPRFGYDFSGVSIYTDDHAARSAQAINAEAYTFGHRIVFNQSRYAPETQAGKLLLAHELTHVVQQTNPAVTRGYTSPPAMTVQRQDPPAAPQPAPVPAPSEEPEPEPKPPQGPTLMMAKPPHFPQGPLTCWASAIASWQRVKGFVGTNVTDQTLLDHYRGTDCVDKDNALKGESDIETVFAEWRLLLKISDEVPETSWTFDFVKSLIEKHGHFIVATGSSSMMHAMVVYGVRQDDKRVQTSFTVFVEDPMASDNEKNQMFFERPIRIVLGTEKRAAPAPCRSRRPAPEPAEE
jgi:hypothetical protein